MLKIMVIGLGLSLLVLGFGCFKYIQAMKKEDAEAKANSMPIVTLSFLSSMVCFFGTVILAIVKL